MAARQSARLVNPRIQPERTRRIPGRASKQPSSTSGSPAARFAHGGQRGALDRIEIEVRPRSSTAIPNIRLVAGLRARDRGTQQSIYGPRPHRMLTEAPLPAGDGSSRKSVCGSSTKARAKARRWRCPDDSRRASRSIAPPRSTRDNIVVARPYAVRLSTPVVLRITAATFQTTDPRRTAQQARILRARRRGRNNGGRRTSRTRKSDRGRQPNRENKITHRKRFACARPRVPFFSVRANTTDNVRPCIPQALGRSITAAAALSARHARPGIGPQW